MSSETKSVGTRIVTLTNDEADALLKLVVALDGFVPENHAVYSASLKLDEQIAAQTRDPYVEVRDELKDALSVLDQWQYDVIDFDTISRKLVDRLLGVYA